MKVHRYFAADMRRALQEVRERQGSDAIILSNRKVPGGVELIAADRDEEQLLRKQPERQAPARAAADVYQENATELRERAGVPELVYTQDQVVRQMRDELRTLRGLLERQVSGLAWGELGRRDPLGAALLRRAMALGLSAGVARSLIRKAPITGDYASASRVLLNVLMQELPITERDPISVGGPIALVGPTGVGKTTLTAKLAVRYAQQHGASSVVLVSLDDQRVGAHEQLRRFGAIAGIAVLTAGGADELRRIIDDSYHRHLVLIDTAGVCHRDSGLLDKLGAVHQNAERIRSFLIMSAATEPHCLSKMVSAYRALSLEGCMVTKLDEASSLGPVLSCAIEQRLPIAYLSDGQSIPEDLHRAETGRLVRDAVKLTQGREPIEDERLEDAFKGEQAYGWV
jgi:flagellar biosynthesis protein FlhF